MEKPYYLSDECRECRLHRTSKYRKESYRVEVSSYRDDDEEAFLRFWIKDNISQTGNKNTVKGQHGGVSSEDLYKLYQEAIDFKNQLALHNNDNMRFNILATSVENVIHTIARYQEKIEVNLDLPSTSLTNEILPYSVSSKISPRPISVELLVLKFIQVPEVEIHIQSDDDKFKTVNGRETAKPHLNKPNGSKTGRRKQTTPGDLVYPPVMTRCDLFPYVPVWPVLKFTPTTEKEKKTWQKFEQEILETEVTPVTLVDEEKRSIALDHPIVSDIGNFAIFTYNKACNMYVKMVEHNLHDIEFMECKYKKGGQIYHFYVTIEAIEEGNLGIYEAEVLCESVGYSRSLCKFNLTNRKPFGMKAMAVSYLSCLRSACKILEDLFNERMTRLNFLCYSLTGAETWAVFDEMERLKELHLETLKGLRKMLYQDAHSLFPPDCDRTTNPGDWHDSIDVLSSGMVPRPMDSTCNGYDYDPYFGWISKRLMALAKEQLWREKDQTSVFSKQAMALAKEQMCRARDHGQPVTSVFSKQAMALAKEQLWRERDHGQPVTSVFSKQALALAKERLWRDHGQPVTSVFSV